IGGSLECVCLDCIPGRLYFRYVCDRVTAHGVLALGFLGFIPRLLGGDIWVRPQAVPAPLTIGLLESQLPALAAGAADHEIEPVSSIVLAVFLFRWLQGSQHRIGQWPALYFGSLHGDFLYGLVRRVRHHTARHTRNQGQWGHSWE